jgi:hypothetical protein
MSSQTRHSPAGKNGCIAETLRRWVLQSQWDKGLRPGLTTAERERLKSSTVDRGDDHLHR